MRQCVVNELTVIRFGEFLYHGLASLALFDCGFDFYDALHD
jgi:hypothetical protein